MRRRKIEPVHEDETTVMNASLATELISKDDLQALADVTLASERVPLSATNELSKAFGQYLAQTQAQDVSQVFVDLHDQEFMSEGRGDYTILVPLRYPVKLRAYGPENHIFIVPPGGVFLFENVPIPKKSKTRLLREFEVLDSLGPYLVYTLYAHSR